MSENEMENLSPGAIATYSSSDVLRTSNTSLPWKRAEDKLS